MNAQENSKIKSPGVSRRSFLKMTGAVAGASVLTCGGLGYLATMKPQIEMIELSDCEGKTVMNEKILLTYATRAGSTGEMAQAMANVFCEQGIAADVRPVKEVRSLEGYRGVVIGSAIRMGRWLGEASKFVETHKAELAGMPVAYFVASGYLRNDTPEMRKTVEAYLDPVRQVLEPQSIGLFAGKMDFSKLPWIERTMAKSMKETEGDFRQWNEIRAWAEGLAQGAFAAQG